MKKVLQIVFCILACACVFAAVLVGVFLGWTYFAVLLAAALLFGALMVLFKNLDMRDHPASKPDFMRTDEENAALREKQDEDEGNGQAS